MRKLQKITRLFVLLAVCGMALGVPQVAWSEGLTQVVVNPATSAVQTCSDQTVAIEVQDVTDLTGYHLEISFDPAVIQVTEVINGGFLDEASEGAFYEPTNEIDNVNGLIRFGMVQQNSSSAPMTPKSGTGDLILITFEAVDWSLTTDITIDISNSMLVDWPNAFEIPFAATDGTVNTQSCAPTDIELSKAQVPENEPVGTVVGQLASVDPDIGDSFTYSLVGNLTYPDNSAFYFDGNVLKTNAMFNFEVKASYNILVRSTDLGGSYLDKAFTVIVTDVNDAPVAIGMEVVTTEDEAVTFTISGYDEDGDDFIFVLVSGPDNGTLPWTPPVLTYTPDTGFEGLDQFEFQLVDEHDLAGNIATVSITANPKDEMNYYLPIFGYQIGK
ncbi:MAG: hypothetical protein H0S79_16635 [Anaerolineaceae bacterium]|nr:hypothetical protein [Anaerolineaceae bacterium]